MSVPKQIVLPLNNADKKNRKKEMCGDDSRRGRGFKRAKAKLEEKQSIEQSIKRKIGRRTGWRQNPGGGESKTRASDAGGRYSNGSTKVKKKDAPFSTKKERGTAGGDGTPKQKSTSHSKRKSMGKEGPKTRGHFKHPDTSMCTESAKEPSPAVEAFTSAPISGTDDVESMFRLRDFRLSLDNLQFSFNKNIDKSNISFSGTPLVRMSMSPVQYRRQQRSGSAENEDKRLRFNLSSLQEGEPNCAVPTSQPGSVESTTQRKERGEDSPRENSPKENSRISLPALTFTENSPFSHEPRATAEAQEASSPDQLNKSSDSYVTVRASTSAKWSIGSLSNNSFNGSSNSNEVEDAEEEPQLNESSLICELTLKPQKQTDSKEMSPPMLRMSPLVSAMSQIHSNETIIRPGRGKELFEGSTLKGQLGKQEMKSRRKLSLDTSLELSGWKLQVGDGSQYGMFEEDSQLEKSQHEYDVSEEEGDISRTHSTDSESAGIPLLAQSFHFEVDYKSERFKYNVGEKVMAQWIDGKWYKATIASVLPLDKAEDTQWRVNFGCKITRIVSCKQIQTDDAIFNSSNASLLNQSCTSFADMLDSFQDQISVVESRFGKTSLFPFNEEVEQKHLTDLVDCTLFTHLYEQNQTLIEKQIERLRVQKEDIYAKVKELHQISSKKLDKAEKLRQSLSETEAELISARKTIKDLTQLLKESRKKEAHLTKKKEKDHEECSKLQKDLFTELEKLKPIKVEAERQAREHVRLVDTEQTISMSLANLQEGFAERMRELEAKLFDWSEREIIGWFSLLGGGRFCGYIDRFSNGVKSLQLTGKDFSRLGDPMVLRLLGLSGEDLEDLIDEIKRVTKHANEREKLRASGQLEEPGLPSACDQSDRCVICYERQKTHAFIPCGHRCVCDECQREIIQCPLCRLYVEKTVKIYI